MLCFFFMEGKTSVHKDICRSVYKASVCGIIRSQHHVEALIAAGVLKSKSFKGLTRCAWEHWTSHKPSHVCRSHVPAQADQTASKRSFKSIMLMSHSVYRGELHQSLPGCLCTVSISFKCSKNKWWTTKLKIDEEIKLRRKLSREACSHSMCQHHIWEDVTGMSTKHQVKKREINMHVLRNVEDLRYKPLNTPSRTVAHVAQIRFRAGGARRRVGLTLSICCRVLVTV